MIRRATPSDHDWIRALAAEVYRELGDYWSIIGSWLDHGGVLSYLDEVDGSGGARVRRGFILLGYYPLPGAAADACVADLLAIAVSPGHQRQGLGRALLDFAIDLARAGADGRTVAELRLTVAEPNQAGRRLFGSSGFVALPEDHGTYEGGQRAIRMSRPLAAGASASAGPGDQAGAAAVRLPAATNRMT